MVDVDNKKNYPQNNGSVFLFSVFIINQSISCIPGKNCCDSFSDALFLPFSSQPHPSRH